MILSWRIARRRIAAGHRPSWRAAWALVFADGVLILSVLAGLWGPVIGTMARLDFSMPATIFGLFVIFFAPLQIVLVVSSLWAAKSRWSDES